MFKPFDIIGIKCIIVIVGSFGFSKPQLWSSNMFFMIAITNGRKDFDFSRTIICSCCGRYGRYQVFMTYTVLSLFFIPCLKWNRRYYVQMSCCNTLYELNSETGRRIARGENVEIYPQDLTRINDNGYVQYNKRCVSCGYETAEDFEYCPKCGSRL